MQGLDGERETEEINRKTGNGNGRTIREGGTRRADDGGIPVF